MRNIGSGISYAEVKDQVNYSEKYRIKYIIGRRIGSDRL